MLSKDIAISCSMLTFVALSAAQMGCAGDVEEYPFMDERGRMCVRSCAGDECTFECSATPMPAIGCPESLPRPCWTVRLSGSTEPGLNTWLQSLCDACCGESPSGNTFSWSSEVDCVPVVCETDLDCAFGGVECRGGLCEQDFVCVADPPPEEPLCTPE